jgi:hypothetical protein
MKPIVTFAGLLCPLAFAAAAAAEKPARPATDRVQTAFEKLVQASANTDWPAEKPAREELNALGGVALPKLIEATRTDGEARVCRSCYERLTGTFAKTERVGDTLVRFGPHDHDQSIRYQSAFMLGDLNVHQAVGPLQAALKAATGKDDEFLR